MSDLSPVAREQWVIWRCAVCRVSFVEQDGKTLGCSKHDVKYLERHEVVVEARALAAEKERDHALSELEFKKGAIRNCREQHLAAEATATQLREAIEAHKADSWVVGHNRIDRKLYEALATPTVDEGRVE